MFLFFNYSLKKSIHQNPPFVFINKDHLDLDDQYYYGFNFIYFLFYCVFQKKAIHLLIPVFLLIGNPKNQSNLQCSNDYTSFIIFYFVIIIIIKSILEIPLLPLLLEIKSWNLIFHQFRFNFTFFIIINFIIGFVIIIEESFSVATTTATTIIFHCNLIFIHN